MKKTRNLIIVGIPLLLVIILTGGVLFTSASSAQPIVLNVNLPNTAKSEPTRPTEEVWAESVQKGIGRGILIDLGNKVVNLADPGGYRYLRVGLVLEFLPLDPAFHSLSDEEKASIEERQRKLVEENRPLIDDVLIGVLSDKTFAEIFNYAGKESLKSELQAAINERLGNNLVTKMYFTDFVIQ